MKKSELVATLLIFSRRNTIMENNIGLYVVLRNIGNEAVTSLEKELVEEHVRTVYENLEFDEEVEKELDECAKELLVCYRLKRRLNEYVEKHIYDSQISPSV
jgi:hypothetical protein